MVINIAASHRFHLLDLARELTLLGHKVTFYSYVPPWRCEAFGLSRKMCVWFWWVVPFFVLDRLFPGKRFPAIIRSYCMDTYLSIFMRNADVLISLSGTYIKSLHSAKKKGLTVILERGSKHIVEQKIILDNIPSLANKTNVTPFDLKKELEGYEIADYISIASQHVKKSFLKHGIDENKLIQNPYGVDLNSFYPQSNAEKKYDLIMVGGWSYRKGCDIISKAIINSDLRFLHVGSIVDLDFPNHKNFTHINSVDQKELINYYNQAKVFILPSREEGLAMVQMQAVSCNLPIVCSKHSGGEDIKDIFKGTKAIFIINEISEIEVGRKIKEALYFYEKFSNQTFYDFEKKQTLSWEAYGVRYERFLLEIFKNENTVSRSAECK